MAKKVFYDDEARKRVLAGAEILYNAVKTTMGPKGRNVVFTEFGKPKVTHDGVTVAKNIEIGEDDETLGYNVGAELIKQAASKMNDVAGDGTTTVTVLTYHILNEANKLIAAGHNPMLLRKGLETAAQDVLAKLEGMREDIQGKKGRIAEVATISAGDAQVGELIAEVMEKVGRDGTVTVEEGQGLAMESEVLEGFTFDRGFVSAYMATDTARMEAVYNKPAIVITDKKISSMQEIAPLLEKIAQAGKKDLVLIAEDVDNEALAMLVLNRLKGAFNTVAVKAPSFGDNRKDVLEDLAILTGATVISEERGEVGSTALRDEQGNKVSILNFDEVDLSMVGSARKVIVSKDNTTIIEGAGTPADVAARIKHLTAQIAATKESYKREQLEERRAALSGKVAVIKVGGATETEIEEKKFRVDDAVAAVKAALVEGVVPGGGVTLVNLADAIRSDAMAVGDEEVAIANGRYILKRALEQPFRTLLTNSGINADEWLPAVRAAKPGHGINVSAPDKLVDMKAAGIVDPARVTKEVLLNAVSIAGTTFTMGALIVDEPKKGDAPAAPDMSGMGMM